MRDPLNALITACEPRGPGTRFVAKDVFDTEGILTTYGSTIFREHVASRTATAVTRHTSGPAERPDEVT